MGYRSPRPKESGCTYVMGLELDAVVVLVRRCTRYTITLTLYSVLPYLGRYSILGASSSVDSQCVVQEVDDDDDDDRTTATTRLNGDPRSSECVRRDKVELD